MNDVEAIPLFDEEKKLSAPFAFPQQSEVARDDPRFRKISLHRLLRYMDSPQRRAKKQFLSLVDSVTWENCLREDRVNLRKTPAVSEIEVFSIHLKPDASAQMANVLRVLFAIDRAVQNPVFFRVFPPGNDGVFYYAARPKKTGDTKLSFVKDATLQQCYAVSGRFVPAMVDASAPLPPARTLEELYIGLLAAIANIRTVPAEKLRGFSVRFVKIQKLRNRKEALQQKKRRTSQLNVLYELHIKIEALAQEISALGGL